MSGTYTPDLVGLVPGKVFNPNFAYPYVRIAKLFETQKQWDLVLENLNKAIQVDPNFSLAYYELFYYYFLLFVYKLLQLFLWKVL